MSGVVTAYGYAHDLSSACSFFCNYAPLIHNPDVADWNVVLSVLAKECTTEHAKVPMNLNSSLANTAAHWYAQPNKELIRSGVPLNMPYISNDLDEVRSNLEGKTPVEAIHYLFDYLVANHNMTDERRGSKITQIKANSQSFCILATVMHHTNSTVGEISAFSKSAKDLNLPFDGRFVNALVRSYGSNIDGAFDAWKNELRPALLAFGSNIKPAQKSRHLQMGYYGLASVCGRAARADLALRLAYAMEAEGLKARETFLRSYHAGKKEYEEKKKAAGPLGKILMTSARATAGSYENLLSIECSQYDVSDKRRAKDKRIRIILKKNQ
eukprot:CAMPEP_0118714428 /NCGR_PEP_ID=MMETSP0800-20121206/26188_1 /TAXON_ID=210618 ORGANISM="Striatella unipunctata, Strain CCMP2910" /NCGR_SAMPLE_ID=MMETSP0800 /ASSEMBLY_ACC=CAM_ASM_000638 /LENGTH=325 /DNA_ID=CAMNT_0006620233 /DNA_START=245 /DNA_END=1222 /DNA_ORIENTATION=+